MKKTIMRMLALALAGLFTVVGFVGCTPAGNGGNDDNNGGGDNGTDGEQFLMIGGIGPLTGDNASYGISVKQGAQYAVDEINAAGGIGGIKLKLQFEDDELNAEKAVSCYNRLMDAGMDVLLGAVTSGSCIAVAEESHKDGILQVTPSGSQIECVKYDNAFRICFNDPQQGIDAANYIKENYPDVKKITVIYDKSSDYSSGIVTSFEARAAELELELDKQAFTDQSKTDFSVQIQKSTEFGADLIFLPIYYQEAAYVATQARNAGIETPFLGCDGIDGIVKQIGDDTTVIEGMVFLSPFVADAEDEFVQTFVKGYQEKYNNETPDQFAADGYDGVYVIKAAIEKAGITDVNDPDLNNKLIAAMTEISVKGLTGQLEFTKEGETTKKSNAVQIINGKYVFA